MAFLEEFAEDEQALLVSLPYRAGVWVSQADNEGGKRAEHAELEALKKIIHQKSSGMFESAFVHEVMVETVTREEQWKSWAEDTDNIEIDCIKAAQLLGRKMSLRDQDAYRQNVMFIATEVARAFREFGRKDPLPVVLWTLVKIQMDKLVGLFTGQRYESADLLNISYEEDIVLAKLSKALRVGVDDLAENAALAKSNQAPSS